MANENDNVKVEYINLDEKKLEEMGKLSEQYEQEEIEAYDRLVEEMEEQEEQNQQEKMEAFDRMAEEMIEEYEKKMEEMGKVAEKYQEEMLFNKVPRKSITVKLLQSTHKKLKIMAASEDKAINMTVTSIVENALYDFDIVAHVKEIFEAGDPMFLYHEEQQKDILKSFYDPLVEKKVMKGSRRKRINVNVDYETYRVISVMAAAQDRTLDNVVSEILENETGDTIEWKRIDEEFHRLAEEKQN